MRLLERHCRKTAKKIEKVVSFFSFLCCVLSVSEEEVGEFI